MMGVDLDRLALGTVRRALAALRPSVDWLTQQCLLIDRSRPKDDAKPVHDLGWARSAGGFMARNAKTPDV